MTLAEFLVLVKKEARVETDTTFDSLIVNLLNELHTEATMQEKVPELKVLNVATNILAASTGIFDLPANYLKFHRVKFVDATGKSWTLDSGDGVIEHAPIGMYGHPKQFEIVDSKIYISPIGLLATGDTLLLDYYKSHTTFSEGVPAAILPSNRLIPFLIRSIVGRIHIYHEKQQQANTMLELAKGAAQGFAIENKIPMEPK